MSRKNTLSVIMDSLKTAYRLDKTAVATTVASAAISSVRPYIAILLSAYVVDGLAAGVEFMRLIWAAAIGLGGIFVLQVLEGAINKVNRVHLEICVRRFDMEMSQKTLTMDFEQLDSPMVNDIRNRIENDRNWGAGFYSIFWQLSRLLSSVFGLAAAMAVLVPLFSEGGFSKGWEALQYLLPLFAITAASALFNVRYVNRKTFSLMDEYAKKRNYNDNFVYGGIDYRMGKDIRIYGAGPLMKKYMEDSDDWRDSWKSAFSRVNGAGGLVSGLTSGILQGGAYLFVVLLAAAGALSVGSVIKYAITVFNFSNSLSGFMNEFSQFTVTAKRQQSTLEYIDVPDVLFKGTIPVEKRSDNEYEIEFHNVSFKYPSSDRYVLRNVSLKLKIGERMAVVGMNGSGKTTFIKLLCRLYDPTEGKITLNGIDIKKYDYNEYLSIFSVVFQDFRLFSVSLGQNIAAGMNYDRSRVEECLSAVGMGERYGAMPQGAETCLYKDFNGKGVEISGGEAQKIALARALYKNAPFIVLDEPTAALDPIAEFEIYSRFNKIVGGKTAIYISHRLSSCRFCSNIAVFHEGRLIQRGSHDALLGDRDGKYCELWNAQAQYYA